MIRKESELTKEPLRVRIIAVPHGFGRVSILSLDAETRQPLDGCFIGPHSQAAIERNKRFERWSESGATEVTADAMPMMF